MNKLPTKIEYENDIVCPSFEIKEWSEPKYQCQECDGGMCRNEMIVLTTYPPKYEYRCNKCGHVDYQYR